LDRTLNSYIYPSCAGQITIKKSSVAGFHHRSQQGGRTSTVINNTVCYTLCLKKWTTETFYYNFAKIA